MVWAREVLSTHHVSGQKSVNTHKRKDAKPQLDVSKLAALHSEFKNWIFDVLKIFNIYQFLKSRLLETCCNSKVSTSIMFHQQGNNQY